MVAAAKLFRVAYEKSTLYFEETTGGFQDGRNSGCEMAAAERQAHFSEVFRRACSEGPHWISRRDKEAVVMISAEDFENLIARANQPRSLVQFFAESPLAKTAIDLKREKDHGRTVNLGVRN
jgi:prevent-host-death family protein